MKKMCSTCKYHDIEGFYSQHSDDQTVGMEDTGLCRRRSPQITGPWVDNDLRFGFWPSTDEVQWCGEWSELVEERPAPEPRKPRKVDMG